MQIKITMTYYSLPIRLAKRLLMDNVSAEFQSPGENANWNHQFGGQFHNM